MYRLKKLIIPLIILFTVVSIGNKIQLPHRLNTAIISFLRFPLKTAQGSAVKLKTLFKDPFADEKLMLEKEIQVIREGIIRLEEVELENERLRKLLQLSNRLRGRKIHANVIAGSPRTLERTILIDKGRKDDMVKNMAVLGAGGLVGRVVDVFSDTSKVMLVTDLNSKTGAIIQKTRDVGIVVGTADRELKMIYLPQDADIEIGDAVISAGLGRVFPKGINIGKVREVANDPVLMYKVALIEPAVDLQRLEEVVCLK